MTGASQTLDALAAALVKAQATFPPIDPDGIGQVGQNRNYKYATLAHIFEVVRPVLAANGLSVTQTCEPGEPNTIRLTTTLLHSSGQWMSGTAVLPLANNTPQGYGSAMTYARRYQLAAILGIASEDDDDGHEGSQGRASSATRARTAPPPPPRPASGQPTYKDMTPTNMTPEGRAWFFGRLRDLGLDHESAAKLLGIKSFKDDMGDQPAERILAWAEQAKLKAAAQ